MASPRPPEANDLPAAFLCPRESPATTAALWRQYLAAPTTDHRNALAVHHLPLAFAVACWMYRRRRADSMPPVDEMLSDCCVGLLFALRDYPHPTPDRFASYATRCMMNRVWESRRAWAWGGRQQKEEKRTIVRSFRRRMVREQGRLPNPDEITAHLQSIIVNPNIQVGDRPQLFAASDKDGVEEDMAAVVDPSPPVGARLMNRETERLAAEGLSEPERKMLGLILEGETVAQIAGLMGLSRKTARRRINGLLWEARCHADLAEHVGASATHGPPRAVRHRGGQPGGEPETRRPSPRERACEFCGVPFQPKRRQTARFCNDKCRLKAWHRGQQLAV